MARSPGSRITLKGLMVAVAACAVGLALYFVPWSTRKPFLKALYGIKPGMTVSEARARMAGYMEGTGIVMPGTTQPFMPAGALIFRHSNDADWGVVTIRDDRVVGVRFDPD